MQILYIDTHERQTMNEYVMQSISICNQIITLLEMDYQELYKHLQGEIYDEYKMLILEEIERVTRIKQELSLILQKNILIFRY